MPFVIRLATINDVPAMHAIRLDVRENRLSSPARISEQDYYPYVAAGSAWVAEKDGAVLGFAAAADDGNIWALFVSPSGENTGIGRALHKTVIGRAITADLNRLTLTTATGARADGFYRRLGWEARDIAPDGSQRFVWQVAPGAD